mgnify:CR=1 FL=1
MLRSLVGSEMCIRDRPAVSYIDEHLPRHDQQVAAVVAVDRPVVVAMNIPVTAELRADLSR